MKKRDQDVEGKANIAAEANKAVEAEGAQEELEDISAEVAAGVRAAGAGEDAPGKKPKKKWSRRRKVITAILCVLLGIVLAVLLAGFLLVRYYLGLIQYDRGESAVTSAETEESTGNSSTDTDENLEEVYYYEEEEEEGEDSPEEEIAALDEQLESQVSADTELLSDENVWNILVIGCDSRTRNGSGRSDTMILVSINKSTEEITMTSIMRDCYVYIPGRGNNRINAAYAYGGASLLLETIETNFKVEVDDYVAIDFYSFVDIVDSIGGIDIQVSDAEVSVMNGYIKELNSLNGRDSDTYTLSEGGYLHLNGTQALAYCRVRYVGNADFDRTQRQRTVMTKVFEKVQTMNVLDISNLLTTLLPEVTTNMSESEILSMLVNCFSYLQYDLNSLRLPVDGSYTNMRVNGMSVLGIDLDANIQALKEAVYDAE